MKPFLILIFSFLLSIFAVRIFLHSYDLALSGRLAMSVMLIFTSMAHFAFNKGMVKMLPARVPFRPAIIYLTGIIELVAAVGLQLSGWRCLTGKLLIIFFILVLPANIYSAIKHIDYQKGTTEGKGPNYLWFRIPLQIFFICWVYFSLYVVCGHSQSDSSLVAEKKWWKEAIVYQVYPRSFKDSDGDGIGDLKGIISRLDYIKSLGIDVVWINPIYSSPNDDNGYDVSDYRNIMKDFGTMSDFDSLIKGLHDRQIKLVMDLVVNHSSDEHEWFKQSRSSRTSPYREYYHWWNAERGKPAARYSLFDINHDAWKYDSPTNAYYLHYFSRKQPDLNWEYPGLRKEVYGIMQFWADKGIDGFRLDAFQFASKDTSFPAFPAGYEKNFQLYYAIGPHLHDYLKEMNQQIFSRYDVMSVAEGAGNSFEDAHNLVDPDRNELNMAYAFDGVDIAKPEGYSLLHFKAVFTRWDSAFAEKGWLSIFLSNHDQARMVSRFGNDSPAFRDLSAKMLTTFILTMRGTPYIFNGDELGMTNAGFKEIKDFRDMQTLNEYKHQKDIHADTLQFLNRARAESRDNGRTPFQWDSSFNAGFTTGVPWIGVNPNYKNINAAAEEKDPNSCLNYFRKLAALRKNNPGLVYGKYRLLDRDNPNIYAYTRQGEGQKMLILLNFTSSAAKTNLDIPIKHAKLLLSNYGDTQVRRDGESIFELRPYEAVIFQWQ